MRIPLVSCLSLFFFCLFFQGCNSGPSVSSTQDSSVASVLVADSLPPEADITADALAWADSIMSDMSLEQLAGQLVMPAVFSDAGEQALRAVAGYAADMHIGGVVLLKGSVEAARAISDTLSVLSVAPPFIAIDAEWGLAMRLKDTPVFPKNGRISQDAEETLLFDYGCEVARECRSAGINMVLGPVLDVLPAEVPVSAASLSSGIGNRSFGSDPERVARLGVAYARGVESGGVMSVAKHFPGHGAADADSHSALPIVSKSLAELKESDLIPFSRYISCGLSGIMVGHLSIPSLDSGGFPVSVSPAVLQDLLREDMGFHGLVLTDAMNMVGADGHSGTKAIMAGADMVIAPGATRSEILAIVDAVRNGSFPLDQLRKKVARVLFYKYLMVKDMPRTADYDTAEAERLQRALSE